MNNVLKKIREDNGFKLKDMAKLCGVTISAYCKIEQGKRCGAVKFWNMVMDKWGKNYDITAADVLTYVVGFSYERRDKEKTR